MALDSWKKGLRALMPARPERRRPLKAAAILALALISLVIILADRLAERREVLDGFAAEGRLALTGLDMAREEAAEAMVLIASFIAEDRQIRSAMTLARHAADADGLESNGVSWARSWLARLSRASWRRIHTEFGASQLHYHLGPGATSLLRMHAPDHYGDDLSDIRHAVVQAIATGTRVSGLETGRAGSGIRGVVPIRALEDSRRPGEIIGAVEAAIGFAPLLRRQETRLGTSLAITVNRRAAFEIIWEDLASEGFALPEDCNCAVEAASHPPPDPVLTLGPTHDTRFDLVDTPDGNALAVTRTPLFDYQHRIDPDRAAVGTIFAWRDVTQDLAAFDARQVRRAAIVVLLSAAVALVLSLLIDRAFRAIERTVRERTAEAVRARELAEQANLAKTSFLSNISHELRTPMNAIVGFSELLNEPDFQGDPQRVGQYAGYIHQSAQQLLRLINTVLDLTQIDAGEHHLDATALRMAGLIKRTRTMLGSQADEAGLAITVTIHPGAETVYADDLSTRQMLLQLLSNAVKFNRPDGEVRIEAEPVEPDAVAIRIVDTGVGIPEEEVERLMRPFEQMAASYTRDKQGPGLGLALVQRLATLNKGHFHLISRLGEGTEARLVLPRPLEARKVRAESPPGSPVALAS
ncbi:MAG: hypothetical protein GVY13_19785 [Alphaproteobacteria bacterium]|jgi:signal transduction histidine kinase|nr:hypothetical protein [Alphaproteobacteria bacterium]